MKQPLNLLCGVLLLVTTGHAQPSPAATAAYNAYVAAFEQRLTRQHQTAGSFIAGDFTAGPVLVQQIAGAPTIPGAMLHHWRGTAFAPGARAADFERMLRAFDAYPQRFAPEVLDAKATETDGDHLLAWMRVRQKHVLTVVMDADYDIRFGHLSGLGGAQEGWSTSRSLRIYELDSTGKPLPDAQAHGFLWRLNSYWSYQERDGGLWIQVESLSLSRAIPPGLGWMLRPYVQSVPRESLEFTLRSAVKAVTR